ncbi:type II toxin-antitoxin system VapC family toxin [Candidatus Woesearchaeota archaeon]|nr:type II toxin-antitoxin system VapC family toxin [Candidatus Woesearchaeota archaeon]
MYCLDTNIIIDIFRGDTQLQKKILGFKDRNIPFFTTCITLCELFKGAYKSKSKEKAIELITDFYKNIKILNFDLASANLFGLNCNILEKKGKKIPEVDVMVASLAMANNCILITRDIKHFKSVPNLAVEKW